MKYILYFFTLLITIGSDYSTSNNNTYWLPEEYVKKIVMNGFKPDNKYLKPIESIYFENENVYVQTFGGKLVKVKAEQINANDKIKLFGIDDLLNLKYFDKEDFNESEFYISFKGSNLILEIYNDNNIDSIEFVNNVNRQLFKDPPRILYEKLLFVGNYVLTCNNKVDSQSVKIDFEGKIKGLRNYQSFKFDRVVIPSINKDFYNIITLNSKNNVETNYAAQYDENEMTWYFYPFTISEDEYSIKTKDNYDFKIKRYN